MRILGGMEERPGSVWLGVPTMIAVLAFLAFSAEHVVIALLAAPVVLLMIGAVVWWGKRRDY